GDPACGGVGNGERLLVDGAGDAPHLGDGADRRDVAYAAVDAALQLLGDEKAAIGVGADGGGLGFEVAKARSVAGADVGVEGGLVLKGGGGARALARWP